MVTHISPTSSVVSSSRRPPPPLRTSRRSSQDTLRAPPPTTAFPPSPPLSAYTSPPSSYTHRTYGLSEPRSHGSRASSVSSRASTSAARDSHDRHRSHRHSSRVARTEVAATQQPETQNSFPWFSHSGDVQVTIRDRSGKRKTDRYLLHSLILTQNSPVLAHELQSAGRLLDADPELGLPRTRSSSRHRSASRDILPQKHHFELDWSTPEATAKNGIPFLIRTAAQDASRPPPRPSNKPPASSTSFFRSLSASLSHARTSSIDTSTTADADILAAYENLFLVFYNHAPRLDAAELSTAYVQCKLLLALAHHYGATPVVAPRVDHHLLRFHRHLWPQIAKYPASYLKLAHAARSRAIFTEALIHVVGQWPSAASHFTGGDADPALPALLEDKAADLDALRARIDLRLFRLSLPSARGDSPSPASNMPDWLALALFRHWLADHTTPPAPGILKDASTPAPGKAPSGATARGNAPTAAVTSVGKAYRALAAGGPAYLGRDELKACLKAAGLYSRDSLRRLERRVDELKERARDAVRPLARSCLELDPNAAAALPYLTCTRVDERDFEDVWGE